MALIKRKQLDLYIKAAPDGTYGLSNLSGIASGAYAITNGDQYETVVDKIVAAIDQLGITTANSYYTYTVDGGSSKQVTLGGSVDFGGTANQITLSKTDATNGVDYTFALPSTLITPGSLKVTTTTELVGNVTLSGNSQTVTHTGTGNLTISSTNGNTLIEGSTFTGNDVTIPGSLGVTGDVTVSGNLNVTGNVTQTSVNDLVVADRFIKLANGNTGTVAVTGIYQQIGLSTYAGLIYNSSDNQFRLFTSTVEPTTSSSMSVLTPATLKIGNLDASQVEFVALGQNAKESIQDLMSSTLVDGVGINLTYSDAGAVGTGTITISVDTAEIAGLFNLQVKTFEDSNTPNQYGINLLSESLTFTDSDTALVKKVSGSEVLKVVTRGTIHEEIVYAASAAAGKFTLSGGNATITLNYNIATDEFKDIKDLKEYVQVFINGVKCRYTECSWTAGQATVTVYGASYSSGGYTGVGFDLDQNDVFTVLYYGDKADSIFNSQVTTTTTTAAPTTTTTTSPITTASELFDTKLWNSGSLVVTSLGTDSTGQRLFVGTATGFVFSSTTGGTNPATGWGGSADPVLSIAVSEDSGQFQAAFVITNSAMSFFNGSSFSAVAQLPVSATGTFTAVGATTNLVALGTSTGEVWTNSIAGGTISGEWSLASGLDNILGAAVTDFTNMYDRPERLIGCTDSGKIFETADSGSTWNIKFDGTDPLYTIASVNSTNNVIVAAAGNDKVVVCPDISVGSPVFQTNTVAGVALGIVGVGFDGPTAALYAVDGTTDVYTATRNALVGASGNLTLAVAQSLPYPVSEAESIGRKVTTAGGQGSGVYTSTLI